MEENYIEKQYVTPEIAKLLKEYGYDRPCIAWYDQNDKFNFLDLKEFPRGLINHYRMCPQIPLWQEVIDWFSEEHNIHILIDVDILGYYGLLKIGSQLASQWVNICGEEIRSDSNYIAREKSILKSLELINKK